MSFMMIDIDDFKLYNDRNGHQAGDLALEKGLDTPTSIIYAADQALYTAKSRGKNCVDAFRTSKLADADRGEK